MPFNVYSLCPCGSGKKVKFCCPDLLGDFEKINRMLDAEQYVNCLQHIEQLQQKHPHRASLMAIRGPLLRITGRREEAKANAAAFVAEHPENVTAWAEAAIVTAVEEGGREAMAPLQRAIGLSGGTIPLRLYEALGVVAEAMLAAGELSSACGLCQFQVVIGAGDERPMRILAEIDNSATVPLLLKQDLPLKPCPDDAPWKARFDDAMEPARKGHWQGSAEKLAVLAEEAADSPVIWWNLATLRGWLADRPGTIDALRKFASLDAPLEDAVEAEAVAMLLTEQPLGDSLGLFRVTWTVRDVEQLQAALTLDRRAVPMPIQAPPDLDGNEPPPRAGYWLLDRRPLETGEGLTLDAVPTVLGPLFLFGRQTDREARLEMPAVLAGELAAAKTMLAELAGDALQPDPVEEQVEQVSDSFQLLRRRWWLPRGVSPSQHDQLARDHRRAALLERWTQSKLGILAGRSPSEAAADPACRIPLLAAIMVLEAWCERFPAEFDLNELRTRLALPTLEPIDPQQTAVEKLPPVRLARVMVEKASDEALVAGGQRAAAYRAVAALRKFDQAIVDRPSLSGREEQLEAYENLARTEEDPQRAIDYLERGRRAAEAAGQSSAAWDLLELQMRFRWRQGDEVWRLMRHIHERHIEEPDVAEEFSEILMRVGLLRPDGTPVTLPDEEAEAPAAAAAKPAAEPVKLWTPDSPAPRPAGGKLWTPE